MRLALTTILLLSSAGGLAICGGVTLEFGPGWGLIAAGAGLLAGAWTLSKGM